MALKTRIYFIFCPVYHTVEHVILSQYSTDVRIRHMHYLVDLCFLSATWTQSWATCRWCAWNSAHCAADENYSMSYGLSMSRSITQTRKVYIGFQSMSVIFHGIYVYANELNERNKIHIYQIHKFKVFLFCENIQKY